MTGPSRTEAPALMAGHFVGETMRRHPAVVPVLKVFGIDTVNGDTRSLEDAAHAARIPIKVLMASLAAAVTRVATV